MPVQQLAKIPWRGLLSLFRREHSNLTPGPLNFIPTDVLLDIVQELQAVDILNLCLTSTEMHQLLLPHLYRLVCLGSSQTCKVTLRMLDRRPELCAHIRKLVVRPKYHLAWPKADEPRDIKTHVWVWDMLAKLRSNGMGPEMAGDKLWRALKHFCPALKRVFCTVGVYPIESIMDMERAVFQFENLTAFSLAVRINPDGSPTLLSRESLPSNLWRMLVEHCPNLEDLTVCSLARDWRHFDLRPIMRGRWPKLRALTLDMTFPIENDSLTLSAEALQIFLAAHPALERLCIYSYCLSWMPVPDFPLLFAPGSLPMLTSFVGVHQQIHGIPFPERIHALDIVCVSLCEEDIVTFASALPRYTALTSLDIRLACAIPPALFSPCPGLVHLRLILSSDVEFFLVGIRHPCTSCPVLTAHDASTPMLHTALLLLRSAPRLAQSPPRLTQIDLSYTEAGPTSAGSGLLVARSTAGFVTIWVARELGVGTAE
ncbi:hypothetical protein DFH09DRAFT_1169631 [Mycena vulgaris]|nr:hypothetical protein DFH09DRAFT_1169631 [Mycena vulgaris]